MRWNGAAARRSSLAGLPARGGKKSVPTPRADGIRGSLTLSLRTHEVLPSMTRNSMSFRSAVVAGLLLIGGAVRAASAADDIVLYAKNATAVGGAWSRVADTTAAGGSRMANPDAGAAKL